MKPLGGRRAQADAAPGDHQLAPFVDRAGNRSDDGLVAARPRLDQPVIPPAVGITAVRRRLRRDPGQPGDIGEREVLASTFIQADATGPPVPSPTSALLTRLRRYPERPGPCQQDD